MLGVGYVFLFSDQFVSHSPAEDEKTKGMNKGVVCRVGGRWGQGGVMYSAPAMVLHPSHLVIDGITADFDFNPT